MSSRSTILAAALISGIAHISLFAYDVRDSIKTVDSSTREITLTFTLPNGEYLYKDSLILSVTDPHVKLSPATTESKPVSFFEENGTFKKEGYTGVVSFTTRAIADPTKLHNTVLNAHFLISSKHEAQEKSFPLRFIEGTRDEAAPALTDAPSQPLAAKIESSPEAPIEKQQTREIQAPTCAPQQPSLLGSLILKIISFVKEITHHAKNALTSLFTSTGSRFLRLAAALLLGIMLSLTPCIYPMIPITVGLLQASGSVSTMKNFLLALSYTLGISTTFALFGLLAALGSCVFGELQGSAFIIIPIALLLMYFGLSMFDIIQLYIPRWLQPSATSVKGGSFLSAYLFGALSGTIASPCLSPGLILILNYVTKITGNQLMHYIESFGLLFVFGVGSSLPLLIIGTFSGSLHFLPKAGAWMNEVKKLVGIMLFSMAFYHLSHLESILPWYILAWIVAAFFILLGCYYFITIKSHDTKWMRRYKNFMALTLIIISCIIAMEGVKAVYDHWYPTAEHSAWMHDYDAARARAQAENKPLFIDIGATYCTVCSHFDKTIFSNDSIQKALQAYVQLKLDADVHTAEYEKVLQKYREHIKGFPTYVVIDTKGTVIKTWSIDIDELSIDALSAELSRLATPK